MKTLLTELKISVVLTLVFIVLLCGVYPVAVWAGAQALFPAKANGSLITDKDGTVRGSASDSAMAAARARASASVSSSSITGTGLAMDGE